MKGNILWIIYCSSPSPFFIYQYIPVITLCQFIEIPFFYCTLHSIAFCEYIIVTLPYIGILLVPNILQYFEIVNKAISLHYFSLWNFYCWRCIFRLPVSGISGSKVKFIWGLFGIAKFSFTADLPLCISTSSVWTFFFLSNCID